MKINKKLIFYIFITISGSNRIYCNSLARCLYPVGLKLPGIQAGLFIKENFNFNTKIDTYKKNPFQSNSTPDLSYNGTMLPKKNIQRDMYCHPTYKKAYFEEFNKHQPNLKSKQKNVYTAYGLSIIPIVAACFAKEPTTQIGLVGIGFGSAIYADTIKKSYDQDLNRAQAHAHLYGWEKRTQEKIVAQQIKKAYNNFLLQPAYTIKIRKKGDPHYNVDYEQHLQNIENQGSLFLSDPFIRNAMTKRLNLGLNNYN